MSTQPAPKPTVRLHFADDTGARPRSRRKPSTTPQLRLRSQVFETNSSSSHSLTLESSALLEQPFDKEVMRSGTLEVGLDEYGWDWYRYYKPENKISYLLTDVLRGSSEDFDTNPHAQQLAKVVKEFSGIEIRVQGDGYIDHESVGVAWSAFDSDDALKKFIFGKDSYVETGNDNSGPDLTIKTDRGSEYYSALTQDALTDDQNGWPVALLDIGLFNGDAKAFDVPESLAGKIQSTGVAHSMAVNTMGPEPRFDNGYTSISEHCCDRLSSLKIKHLGTMRMKENHVFSKDSAYEHFPRITSEYVAMSIRPDLFAQLQAYPLVDLSQDVSDMLPQRPGASRSRKSAP